MNPYYQDEHVTLYLGDMREVLPALGEFDACVTDPPYGETSLAWDRWPDGWPGLVAEHTRSLWCFGSMRMFLKHRDQFAVWKLAQDTVGEFEIDTMVWEKNKASGPVADRFRRVHELATQWYRGLWRDIYHEVPRIPATADRVNKVGAVVYRRSAGLPHRGDYGPNPYIDDGMRLARSVVRARVVRGRDTHPTEKPLDVLSPLIEFSVPPGGLVLDPFAGSGSTLFAARRLDRRAVGIEASEEYCEKAAARLSIPDLFGGVA
jgi:site-specific DNA-methyltransferase (adenine-specific)